MYICVTYTVEQNVGEVGALLAQPEEEVGRVNLRGQRLDVEHCIP